MQITLNQTEIEKAIIGYIASQGVVLEEDNTSVSLTAGRGANGMSATVDIYSTNTTKKITEYISDSNKETETIEPSNDNTQEEQLEDSTPLFGS